MSAEFNGTQTTDETKRTPYHVDIEPSKFLPDAESKFVTSLELCQDTRDIFKAAFADFYGCKFEILQGTGVPMITLLFSHVEAPEGQTVATAPSSAKTTGSSVIDKTRSRDHLMKEGDKYVLTQDGLDIIKPLLLPHFVNRNTGKVDLKRIVSPIADVNQSSMFAPANAVQLTQVIGIDPRKIAAMIWGEHDTDGGDVDYGITILKDLSANGMAFPGMTPQIFALKIDRAHSEALKKTYEKIGISTGSNIVR